MLQSHGAAPSYSFSLENTSKAMRVSVFLLGKTKKNPNQIVIGIRDMVVDG